jgi:DME family drug/metabolite transporter
MHTRTIGASQVLLAGVFWGTYGTFASFLPESISPLAVGAIKLAIGAIGLAVILMVSHRGRIISKGTRFPIPTLLSCAVALAIAQTSIYMGVRNAGVTIATMIFIGTPPLFSGLFAQFVRKERQSLSWLVSSIIIALGCFFMAISGDTTADGNRLLIGSLFAATAGATWTFVGTNLRSMQKHATPLESSFVVMGAASLVLMPIVAFQGIAWIAEPGVFSLALALGFVSTAIPYWLFTTGARRILSRAGGIGRTARLYRSSRVCPCHHRIGVVFLMGIQISLDIGEEPAGTAGIANCGSAAIPWRPALPTSADSSQATPVLPHMPGSSGPRW